MVSKTLIHKQVYNITSPEDIPNLSIEKIAHIISNSPKVGTSVPINFEELKVLDNLNKFLDDLPKNQ